MTPYEQAITANYQHMGTSAAEWSATPIKSMDGGFANYDYPAGYTSAPSLYRNTGNGENGCCELCAHPIKNVFIIQNDTRKWIMQVGSECVTHFGEGKSGAELAREKMKADKRDLLRLARRVRDLAEEKERAMGYSDQSDEGRTRRLKAYQLTYALKMNVKGYFADPTPKRVGGTEPAASDAKVSAWFANRGDRAKELIGQYVALYGEKI
jgi:hypothetical protein